MLDLGQYVARSSFITHYLAKYVALSFGAIILYHGESSIGNILVRNAVYVNELGLPRYFLLAHRISFHHVHFISSNMKRLFLAFFVSIVFDLIFLPLCSQHLLLSVYNSQYINDNLRIDLRNRGSINNTFIIKSTNQSKPLIYSKDQGQGLTISDNITSSWQDYNICTEVVNDGEMEIMLLGPYVTVNNERYPIVVDYKNLNINGKCIFERQRPLWRDNQFSYKFEVKDKEIVDISFRARRHHFKISDFTQIYQTNLWMLSTIIVFSFILSYKLVYFAVEFQLVEKKNLGEVLFLYFFFILSFIPMSRINPEDISIRENRRLAKKPDYFTKTGINSDYGFEAESWFNDRFMGRALAIKLEMEIKYWLNRIYKNRKAVLLTNGNWMFNNMRLSVPDADISANMEYQLINLRNFCKKNSIKLYILFVPYKGSVYHEILESRYVYNIDDDHQFKEHVDRLRKNTGIPIIYPYEQLRNAREKDYVFFKQSHHWTDWGAYNGYQALMNTIKEDFPDIKIVSLDDYKKFTSRYIRDDWDRIFNVGFTTRLLGFDPEYARNRLLNTTYNYYDHNEGNILKNQTENQKLFSQNTGGGYKILLTGNSQNENLLQFLPYSARSLKYIRLNIGKLPTSEQYKFLKYYKKDVLDFKPDILVYCVSSEVCIDFITKISTD